MRVRIIEPGKNKHDENIFTEEIFYVDAIKIKEEALQSTKILIKTVYEEIIEIDKKDVLYMSDLLIVKNPI